MAQHRTMLKIMPMICQNREGMFRRYTLQIQLQCSQKAYNHLKAFEHLKSFTHPQVVPNLYECLCSAEHKGNYSEECGKQSSSGAPLTSIVFFFLLWKSIVSQNSLVTNFLQNIFLCVRQNKEIQRFGTTWGWVNYISLNSATLLEGHCITKFQTKSLILKIRFTHFVCTLLYTIKQISGSCLIFFIHCTL